MKEHFGDRIKQARKEMGFTQGDLSDVTGINRTTIANYETGRVEHPQDVSVIALANALNVNFDWLRDGKGPIHPSDDEQKEVLLGRIMTELRFLNIEQLEMVLNNTTSFHQYLIKAGLSD